MHGVQDQLDADEAEQERQPVGQVDQALQQPADEEVELAQAHQREDVRGEDDVGVLGQAVDRRDRVEREQQVGGAERQDHQEHRGDQSLAALPHGELRAVPLLGGREVPLGEQDELVLLVLVVVLSLAPSLASFHAV